VWSVYGILSIRKNVIEAPKFSSLYIFFSFPPLSRVWSVYGILSIRKNVIEAPKLDYLNALY
jgi:glycerol-3-phosphate responsive antiterminator